MEKNEKINSDEYNTKTPFEINTGLIFSRLTGTDANWRKYNREFLSGVVLEALESTLERKNIVTVEYNGENGAYLKNEEEKYFRGLELSKDLACFPFPDYFLKPDKKSTYLNIVSFDEPCIIVKTDYLFDLFFALQFSLTDIVKGDELEADDFLKHHLQNTYDNDFQKFQDFLENLCLKYSEFLKDKYEPLVKRFIENSKQKEQILNSAKRAKLNWLGSPSQFGYVFLELAKKGFIELPPTSGQGSYSRYAKVCWDLFDFQKATTPENLQKEMNPTKNTLSESVRSKFEMPSQNEISKNKKE